METFPSSYIAPAYPLIVLSGLIPDDSSKENAPSDHNGPIVNSESPNVPDNFAQTLLNEFQKFEPAVEGNFAEKSSHAKPMYFRFKKCGRQYALPNRKSMSSSASERPMSPLAPTSPNARPRSVLSPLTPGAPLYPDGIMTAIWTQKYQEIVPSLMISFFALTFEQEYKTLNDNRMKNEIIAIKASLAQSYSRIRFMVVITSEKSLAEEPELEERLNHIRRATKLDNKTGLSFCGPSVSPADLSTYVADLLSDVRPTCLDFYREMVKHTRKKRDKRGTSAQLFSPIDESTKLLGKAGWAARDEFKLGFLSEFCLEIDASNRHYNAAWEAIFGFGGVFDTVSPSNVRWHEHFQFASILAIRFARCLLAAGMPSSAVRLWKRHQLQLLRLQKNDKHPDDSSHADIIWTKSMAQLIREIPQIAVDLNARKIIESIAPNKKNVYTEIERALSSDEKLRPWERLHHTGYWMMYCASQVQSAENASGAESPKMLTGSLEEAAAEFAGRGQARMSDHLKLKLAQELSKRSDYDDAFKILKLLWQRNSWRASKWWLLLGEVTFWLHLCAKELGDFDIHLSTLWELSSRSLKRYSSLDYDIDKLLHDSSNSRDGQPDLQIRQEDIESFLQFSFQSSECHAGEPVTAQLQIKSLAHEKCKPITLSHISLQIEGKIRKITLHHDASIKRSPSRNWPAYISDIRLQIESSDSEARSASNLSGSCNLACAPGELLVLNMIWNNDEAGILSAIKAVTTISGSSHSVQYSVDLRKNRNHASQFFTTIGASRARTLQDASKLKVLPKLPKATISLSDIQLTYSVNETSFILAELENLEKEPIDASLRIWFSGTSSNGGSLEWDEQGAGGTSPRKITEISRSIGLLEPAEQVKTRFRIQLPPEELDTTLKAEIVYSLLQSSKAKLNTSFSVDIKAVQPFEAKYRLMPTLHSDPWPSYFLLRKTLSEEDKITGKLLPTTRATRWLLKTTLMVSGGNDIAISRVELKLTRTSTGCHCIFHTSDTLENNQSTLSREYPFIFDIHEDEFGPNASAGSPTLEAELVIRWHRKNSAATLHTSSLPIPQLTFPTQEPRVFAQQLTPLMTDTSLLEIIIENPSAHYLSFDLALEPNDDFGFSGPKALTLHLVPYSRHSSKFTLLPFVKEAFIQPKVQVTDIYFNKVLPINPVGGLRIDHQGILLWVG